MAVCLQSCTAVFHRLKNHFEAELCLLVTGSFTRYQGKRNKLLMFKAVSGIFLYWVGNECNFHKSIFIEDGFESFKYIFLRKALKNTIMLSGKGHNISLSILNGERLTP